VTGAQGQLGSALLASIPPALEVRGVSHGELDITNSEQVAATLAEFRPQVVINAAAYTAVDKAEAEPSRAMLVNATGPAYLARAALASGARLIHISTDFVFDGRSSRPYLPDDPPAPLGAYGRSKLAGESEVLRTLPQCSVILRTAWLYGTSGHNFARTILRLLGERERVDVVCDQVGTPTAAHSLAGVTWQFALRADLAGVFSWTDAGVASWYDFAVAIEEESRAAGLLRRSSRVQPIATAQYPTPAKRPAYSVLDNRKTAQALDLIPVHWRVQLRTVIKGLAVA
jgi:dTDP-4-dehydrorhamnose reductase